mgnify:CR=1 FL=1
MLGELKEAAQWVYRGGMARCVCIRLAACVGLCGQGMPQWSGARAGVHVPSLVAEDLWARSVIYTAKTRYCAHVHWQHNGTVRGLAVGVWQQVFGSLKCLNAYSDVGGKQKAPRERWKL